MNITTKVLPLRDSDLVIGYEYLTKKRNGEWIKMIIRDKEELLMVLNTLNKHQRVVECVTRKTFFDMKFIPTKNINLPSWYNVTDGTVVYQEEYDEDDFEVSILVYQEETNKISMFLLNRTELINQLYLVFLGVPCETNNDLFYIMSKFGLNEKKAQN